MVMVKCTKRNDDCQYVWGWIGRNNNKEKRRFITCPACGFKIKKEKAIRAYQEWKNKNRKEAEKLENELNPKITQENYIKQKMD